MYWNWDDQVHRIFMFLSFLQTIGFFSLFYRRPRISSCHTLLTKTCMVFNMISIIWVHIPTFCNTGTELSTIDCIIDALETNMYILDVMPCIWILWLVCYHNMYTLKKTYANWVAFLCVTMHCVFLLTIWQVVDESEMRFAMYLAGFMVYLLFLSFSFGSIVCRSDDKIYNRTTVELISRPVPNNETPEDELDITSSASEREEENNNASSATIIPKDALLKDDVALNGVTIQAPEERRGRTKKKSHGRNRSSSQSRNPRLFSRNNSRNELFNDTSSDDYQQKRKTSITVLEAGNVAETELVQVPLHEMKPISETPPHEIDEKHGQIAEGVITPPPPKIYIILANLFCFTFATINLIERHSFAVNDTIHDSVFAVHAMHYVQHTLCIAALVFSTLYYLMESERQMNGMIRR